jgi:dTDP-4-dehydrorhamnose reductase
MTSPKFLLIGADSGVGYLLGSRWTAAGQPWIGTTRRPRALARLSHLDLAVPPVWNDAFAGANAAVLCAGITSTARCFEQFEDTFLVNVMHTVALAEMLCAKGVPVIFLSSNLVFDGSRAFMPRDAATHPASAYGRQKAAAEGAVLRAGGAVARLTKVLTNIFARPKQWRDALQRGETIEAFSDMPCAPIAGEWVAAALDALARRFRPGIYQFSASRDLSYAELAERLASRIGAKAAQVRAVSWRDAAPNLEHVPVHTTLAMGAPESELGFTPADPELAWDAWVSALAH